MFSVRIMMHWYLLAPVLYSTTKRDSGEVAVLRGPTRTLSTHFDRSRAYVVCYLLVSVKINFRLFHRNTI